MSNYAVVYWKNLSKDKISIREFTDEAEMVEFAEEKKVSGHGVLVTEKSHSTIKGDNVYSVWHYGAYYVFRYLAIYLGIILIVLFFLIILIFKGKGI